jgi:putative methyltransferase (TIGR04325 family)
MKFYRSGFASKSVRRVAEYLSPFILNVVKYVFSEMEYVPQGWNAVKGWNDQSVADAQEQHWPTLVRNLQGPGPLGVSHLPWHITRDDRADHNIIMSYGYVLALAARKKDVLSILDWGGGVGHYYLYSKALLPEVGIEYHCYDVPNLCRLGRKLLPEIHSHDDERDLLGRQYDVVVSSSSLHYFEDWRDQVRKLAAATRGFLYVSRLQVVNCVPSFVVVHKVLRAGYTEFLSWSINRQEFLSCAEECGLELVREFVFTEQWTIRGAPEKAECRGFLFRQQTIPEGDRRRIGPAGRVQQHSFGIS